MEAILDFSRPMDVALLDTINRVLVESTDGNAIYEAQQLLCAFRDHPEAFRRIDVVLQSSTLPATLFFALQVLEKAVSTRWNQLTLSEQLGIRNFLVGLLVQWCADVDTMRALRVPLGKLNVTIVAIAKHDWPHRWPKFVQEVVESCEFGAGMLQNNLRLLAILGEEVFVFGERTMTRRWIERRKEALGEDIGLIFELCRRSFASEDPAVQLAAMLTFEKYIAWVPLSQVFEPVLFDFLVSWALPKPELRQGALQCLIEISGVRIPPALVQRDTYFRFLAEMFEAAVAAIVDDLPTNSNAVEERVQYCFAEGSSDDERVFDLFAQLLCAFLRNHIALIKNNAELLQIAHRCLLGLTYVHHKEIFKTCTDYWWFLGDSLVRNTQIGLPRGAPSAAALQAPQTSELAPSAFRAFRPLVAGSNSGGNGSSGSGGGGGGGSGWGPAAASSGSGGGGDGPQVFEPVYHAVKDVLSGVRSALTHRMAKPEEVVIVEDENGELQHVLMTDVETITMYNTMREALLFLTTLDHRDMRRIIIDRVKRQADGSEWTWHNLSTLCWAVGSIGGSMPFDEEKELFAEVIKTLLDMCSSIRGSDNKAVIASNIMYVTGQYPRFLAQHERFLFTVVNKLFEFMREKFPGVMDMAVDTFLKIAQVVPRSLAKYACEIIKDYKKHVELLSERQQCVFFEAVGVLVRELRDPAAFEVLLGEASMVMKEMAAAANENVTSVLAEPALAQLAHALRLNTAVAKRAGTIYIEQFRYIFLDLQLFYNGLGAALSQQLAPADRGGGVEAAGAHRVHHVAPPHTRALFVIKKEILRLLETFIENTEELDFVAEQCMPIILEFVLTDYHAAAPVAKDPLALRLITTCVQKLRNRIAHNTAAILDLVFDTTVALITENLADFPEHRVNLFKLVGALNECCFPAFLECCTAKPDVIEGILWAAKHPETDVMMTGLATLEAFVSNIKEMADIAQAFFATYMRELLSSVLTAMLDTLHRPGFEVQCAVIRQLLLTSLAQGHDSNFGAASVAFVISETLAPFSTLTPALIEDFTREIFASVHDEARLRSHMSDLLIEVQVWGAEEETRAEREAAQREREALIPGFQRHGARASYLPPLAMSRNDMNDPMLGESV